MLALLDSPAVGIGLFVVFVLGFFHVALRTARIVEMEAEMDDVETIKVLPCGKSSRDVALELLNLDASIEKFVEQLSRLGVDLSDSVLCELCIPRYVAEVLGLDMSDAATERFAKGKWFEVYDDPERSVKFVDAIEEAVNAVL